MRHKEVTLRGRLTIFDEASETHVLLDQADMWALIEDSLNNHGETIGYGTDYGQVEIIIRQINPPKEG